MSPSRRRGRRVPPKRGARSMPPPWPTGAVPGAPPTGAQPTDAAQAEAARRLTRAQNRAAKRASSGVQAKRVRGQVSGRRNRSYNPVVLGLAFAAVLVGAAVLLIGKPFGGPVASSSPSAGSSAASYGDGTCPTSQPAALKAGDLATVTIQTAKGTIVMQIDGSRAPIATGNFIALVACHFYDGLTFHRLVPGFVIQGGDPAGDGSGGPGYSIQDDPLVGTYKRGTIAMARTAQPNSQGSQFFIVLSDDANAALTNPANAPYPYAILGEVTAGMDVVDAIAAMPNSGPSSGNAAIDPIVMTSVTVGPAASSAPSASAGASTSPTTGPTSSP
jgi:cyclophilin family peptidyl-prolyl cis-trans isomerase